MWASSLKMPPSWTSIPSKTPAPYTKLRSNTEMRASAAGTTSPLMYTQSFSSAAPGPMLGSLSPGQVPAPARLRAELPVLEDDAAPLHRPDDATAKGHALVGRVARVRVLIRG